MLKNIRADVARLSKNGKFTWRALFAGLLSQGFQAIMVYRFFNLLHRNGLPGQPIRFVCERLIEITTGISIPAQCLIGKGFRIHHFGGIIFHPTVAMGENCTVYHGVTIGDVGGHGGAAVIGNNVLIGAGAKIIGEVFIGDNAIIGANAVVTRDVPRDTVAIGAPARHHPRKDKQPACCQHGPVLVMDFRGTYKGGGGPDKTILNSAAMHDPERVDVRVAYLRDPRDREFQIGDRARAMGLKYTEFSDRALLDIKCLRDLLSFVRQEGIQLLHAHDDKTSLYGVILKLLNPSLRLVFTCHLHTPLSRERFETWVSYSKALIRRRVVIWLMKRYQRPIMAVSEHTRSALADDGLALSQTVTLVNCIDVQTWSRRAADLVLRGELGLDPRERVVGTVARIAQEHKDLPTFYKVARLVTQRVDDVRFVIVGEGHGDLLERAKQEVARLGLTDRVVFTGHRNDLLNVYASFDLFLMTSFTEGLPNTVLEAMAMEVPVVSTAVAGVKELVIDGETGILRQIRDEEGLSDAVITMLSDPELSRRFSKAGRKLVEERFNFRDRVQTLERFYHLYSLGSPVERFTQRTVDIWNAADYKLFS
jgi:L-malate glycosyltransferase